VAEAKDMKKQLIIIGIVTILLNVGLSGCSGPTQGVYANKVSVEPSNYVNMTEQQMEKFPHLKQAILMNESVESPQEELIELWTILDFFDAEIIKYQNEYYEIGFVAAD
jgi:hypothetical protein